MVKACLPSIFWLSKRIVSITYAPLDGVYGLGNLVSKPREIRTKHKKSCSLDTYHTLHLISYDMMWVATMQSYSSFIVFSMKDLMTSMMDFSASMPSICFVSSIVPILRKLKFLLMHLLIWIFVYPFSEKQNTNVHVSPTNKDPRFGFELRTDELYKQVYIGIAKKKNPLLLQFTNQKMAWKQS